MSGLNELDPGMVLKAYAMGVFPMADHRAAQSVYWVEPKLRGILPIDRFHLSRSLRKTIAADRYRVTADAAFRHVRVALDCPTAEPGAEAGRNLHGDAGWAFALDCRDSAGAKVQLVIGWGIRPEAWKGAALPHGATEAQGVVAPGAVAKWRITATKATPPLGEAAPPTPADIPNNHFAYAIQWFAFAGVLLLIYTLLVRRWRLASAGGNE